MNSRKKINFIAILFLSSVRQIFANWKREVTLLSSYRNDVSHLSHKRAESRLKSCCQQLFTACILKCNNSEGLDNDNRFSIIIYRYLLSSDSFFCRLAFSVQSKRQRIYFSRSKLTVLTDLMNEYSLMWFGVVQDIKTDLSLVLRENKVNW